MASRTCHQHHVRQARERGPGRPRRLSVLDCGNERGAHGGLDSQRIGRRADEGCESVRGEPADRRAGARGEQIQDAVDAGHLYASRCWI